MSDNSALAAELLKCMRFRCIGPPRGGRVVAVAGDPEAAEVFYFGAVAGGVWKTEDAGSTWRNVSDGHFATASVGALAVSDSDPNVIYAGMGESTIRNDVSHGDGVYRSSDGGQHWRHMGLVETRHISAIRVHPRDPDCIYVAALGHAFGEHPARGVYHSRDGGRSFDLVLHRDARSGAADLSLDPRNPDVLFATTWETHRNFWELSSGGPGSGLWRSMDGGEHWSELSKAPGLPVDVTLGKVGVSVSPARSGRVFALIEASEGAGLYRSEDFGDTWALVSDRQDLRYRPWYYMHVFADPCDPDTVYVNNLGMWRSTDGGRTFDEIPTPHGDNHALWIDPRDNRRLIQGNDGGANVSFNAGASWSSIYNQLTAQIYTVTTDNRAPHYRVYGTQQDNSSISVPSGSNDGAIVWGDCYPAGTGESGFMAVHPMDDDVVFVGAVGSSPGGGGALQRYDHTTGQIQLVNVWPEAHGGIGPGELRYRFPWTFPVLFSPHAPHALLTAGNVVFRSLDEGHSWTAISPDLTRNTVEKLGPSGGPITKDTSGAEHYCTISTLRESTHEPGVFWVGSDDGLVHVSRDDGGSWQAVTPPTLPEWSFIRTVEPSPHAPGTVYVAATRYKLDDTAPYLYRSTDYGSTWTAIVGSGEGALPGTEFVRVIRADPAHAGLLYVGTETGIFVSLDDGDSWQRWSGSLPVTPVYDLTVKGTDLVVATHGRSFWIADDLTPLQQLARGSVPDTDGLRLFTPRATWRLLPDLFAQWIGGPGKNYSIGLAKAATYIQSKDDAEQVERDYLDAGQAAPAGALIYYHLHEPALTEAPVQLEVLDADARVVRRFVPKPPGYATRSKEDKALEPGPFLPLAAGMNRFLWDLRHAGAKRLKGNKTGEEANRGPLVLPGRYTARLRIGERVVSRDFEVRNDPRSPASAEALAEQLGLLLQIRDKLSETYTALAGLRSVREQLEAWTGRLADDPERAGLLGDVQGLIDALGEVESALIQPGAHTDTFGLNLRVRLNAALASVISIVDSADARPTTQALALADEYMGKIDAQLEALTPLLGERLAAVNTAIAAARLPAIAAPG